MKGLRWRWRVGKGRRVVSVVQVRKRGEQIQPLGCRDFEIRIAVKSLRESSRHGGSAGEPSHSRPCPEGQDPHLCLNLISRNLPLPPDVFNAVSSIYHADDLLDRADVDTLDTPSEKVSVRLLSMPPFLALGLVLLFGFEFFCGIHVLDS
ncbi:hypothetical protein CK203_001315 [Vitis vinifera]|uniref:Uncharacterized protein n=1 Tax=Vitis vinifera TaxID=29760 RepID=A0A438KLM3_VITVI|nr:hypothetical protein CK203_001315 [Vitis vinifera]